MMMVKSTLTDNSWYQVDNVAEISSPALLLFPGRIESNIQAMIKIAGKADRLRPHVKTHKSAEITRLQINAGICKFKCATVAEAEMVAMCGAKEVILAMQPVGPNSGRFFRLKQDFPETEFSCIADSEGVIRQLSDMAVKTGLKTGVWLDINNGMNRTGIQPGDDAAGLVQKIADLPMLVPEGLHLHDGHIIEKDIAQRIKVCNDYFAPVASLLEKLTNAGISGLKIVAGGTSTFTVHALRKDMELECSPGTTLLWDYGYSSSFPDMEFLHAAVLLTRIISKPAKDLICLDLGSKAVASEMPQPRIMIFGLDNYSIVTQSEEHMVIRTTEADNLNIGDPLYGIPWHICPTVDRYDTVSVVRGGRVTEEWIVKARRRKITI